MLEVLIWCAAVATGLWGLHRLALWAEARGWIYYKHRKASPGTAASAFLDMHALLEPDRKHVVEFRREDEAEDDSAGDPPPGVGGLSSRA